MDSINDLLKLKRHETPREGYMDDFVKEFHQRQRLAQRESEKSGRFFEGLSHWFHTPPLAAVPPSRGDHGLALGVGPTVYASARVVW